MFSDGWRVGLLGVLLLGAGPPPVLVAAPPAAPAAKPAQLGTPIALVTEDNVTLNAGYLPGRKGGPAVVLLHQYGRDHEEWGFFAESLQRSGLHVLALDLRGHGKSLMKGAETLDAQQLKPADFQDMTRDVAAAVGWLRGRPDVDGARVALVGSSLGANLALQYAAGDPAISHVALLSPGLEYKGISTEDAVQRYGRRPLFLAVSREDSYSAKSVLVLDASSPSAVKEIKIFTGAGHGTRMLSREPALETSLLTWLNGPAEGEHGVGDPPALPERDAGTSP